MMQETEQWLNMADMDMGVAKHLMENYYPKPYEIICYHCQQAAEKAIKALIVQNGCKGGMPKIHDLSFLLGQIKNDVKIEEKYYDYADILTPYGISVRYPNELFIDEKHAEDAVQYADRIVQWVHEWVDEQD